MKKEKFNLENKLKELKKFIKDNLFYILTGITLLVIGGVIIFNYTKSKQTKKQNISSKEEVKEEKKKKVRIHVVKKGEHLWMIAEKYYGSGYNAIDIAKANKIKNPNIIYVGQKLIIPQVKPRKPTTGKIAKVSTQKRKASFKKYTVKKGDYLWKIALEAYVDGYAWIKIARANKIKNPSLIYPGQKLIIP